MRLPHLLLLGALACAAAIAQPVDFTPAPARPVVPFVKLETGFAPMAAIDRSDWPTALVEGKSVRAEDRNTYAFLAGDTFAPGHVAVTQLEITNWSTQYTDGDNVPFSSIPTHSVVSAKLTSDIDIEDASILLLVFDSDQSTDSVPAFGASPRHVGKLRAGKGKKIQLKFPPLGGSRRWAWSIVVFSGGQQIRSSGDNAHALPRFLDITERFRHAQKLSERRRGPDAAVGLFRRMPFEFSDELKQRYAGQSLMAAVDIDRDGEVSRVRLLGDLSDPALRQAVVSSLRLWLFLPPLKNGSEIGTTVHVPIKF